MTSEKHIFVSDGWLSFSYDNFFQINVKDLKLEKNKRDEGLLVYSVEILEQ